MNDPISQTDQKQTSFKSALKRRVDFLDSSEG